MYLKDLTNQKFGRLTTIKIVGKDKYRNISWLCQCECGNSVIVSANKLLSGNTKSCGCLQRDLAAENCRYGVNYKHGMLNTPTYRSWKSMIQRCYDKNSPDYKRWGARGIIVCNHWRNSFLNFLHDMGLRPTGKTLDRFDNNGNYEKQNCKWSTPKEQANNRRFPLRQTG